MPQIAPVPIDEPVARPRMSPAQAGSAGETVAGLGAESAQLAISAESFEGYLLGAQRQLKYKQAEIAFDAAKVRFYDDLGKATTPEEAEAIYEHHRGNLDKTLAPFETDRVLARELGLYRQHEDNEIRRTVNAKKAHIVAEANAAADDVKFDKSLQQGIADTMGGGSPTEARGQYWLWLKSGENQGLLLPQQVEEKMHKWDRTAQSGIIEAKSNSDNAYVREQNINELRDKGVAAKYPDLNQAELSDALTKSEKRDQEIRSLQEHRDLNADIHGLKQDTATNPRLKGANGTPDFEAMKAVTRDDDWLIDHGMYTIDPSTGAKIPDYVRGSKLLPFINAEEVTFETKAKKEADKYRDEIYDHFASGDIAGGATLLRQHKGDFEAAKTDYYPTIIDKMKSWISWDEAQARATRVEARAEAREERAEAHEAARQEIEAWKARGDVNVSQIEDRMDKGEVITEKELVKLVRDKQLTPPQADHLWKSFQKSTQNEDYRNGKAIITNSSLPDDQKAALLYDYRHKFEKEHLTGADAIKYAEQLTSVKSDSFLTKQINRFKSAIGAIPSAPGKALEEGIGKATGKLPVGTVKDGYKYLGGDPADRHNWEKVGGGA